MPSNFPAALDVLDDVPASQASAPTHDVVHNTVHDILEAIEATIGVTTESRLVQRYASASARNTALASAVEGVVAYIESNDELHLWDGAAWQRIYPVADHDAARVATGTLADARIPNLNASKTNAGTFADARIPNLNASKVTAGTFADARIPNLNASKVTAGVFALDRIPDIPAADITAGAFKSGNYEFPTRLGIGGTNTGRVLYVESDSQAAEFYRATPTPGDGVVVFSADIGGTQEPKHIFYADGDALFDGTLTAPSDRRLKKNVRKMKPDDAIGRVMSWELVTFDWRAKHKGAGRGVIAQQIEESKSPDLVRDRDNRKSVDYSGMIPDLARAVQAIVEELGLGSAD